MGLNFFNSNLSGEFFLFLVEIYLDVPGLPESLCSVHSKIMKKEKKSIWSEKAKLLAKDLHNELSLDNYNWHQFRGNKHRRSAELITSSLSQLIHDGDEVEIET